MKEFVLDQIRLEDDMLQKQIIIRAKNKDEALAKANEMCNTHPTLGTRYRHEIVK